jgi:hypothetical protein
MLSPEEQYAQDMGVTLGPVEVVREVNPDEQMVLVEECLVSEGWPVELTGEGYLSIQVPTEQEQAYTESMAQCKAMYPIAEKYVQPWGEREYAILYDHWVSSTIPCLRDQGYRPEDPPARETFVASMVRGEPEYFVDTAVQDAVSEDVAAGKWATSKHFWSFICSYDPPDASIYGDE